MTTPPSPRRSARWVTLLVMCGAALAALIMYIAVSGDARYLETGDSYPGAVTAALAVAGVFAGMTLGAVVLGALTFVAVCGHFDRDNVIDVGVYRAHRLVERAAPLWCVVAVMMIAVAGADRSGIPIQRVLYEPAALPTLVDANEQAVAWMVVAALAAAIGVCARFGLRWSTHVLLVIPTAVAVVAVPVSGNAGQGPNHDYTTSAAIVLTLAVSVGIGVRVAAAITLGRDTPESDLQEVTARLRWVTTIADFAAIAYGAVLLSILLPADEVVSTAFGRAATAAGLLLVVVAGFSVRSHFGDTTPSAEVTARRTAMGAACGIATLAAAAILETRTAPGLLAHEFTGWDVYLGYELPDPPTVARLVTTWRPDLFIGGLAIVAGIVYLLGVRRLRQLEVEWPRKRTASWLIGCVGLLVVSSSGLRAYGMAMFSVHMVEHMVLNMFIPVLLVLGAPVTLALRALPTARHGVVPGPREWLTALLHSPLSRFLCHPLVALSLFVGSLYAVYFTPLFDTLARYHWGHEAMSIHFLVTGYLFFWSIIGIDPGPRRLPFLARLGLLFAVMPFHAFFGIATMTMTSIIGGQFYRSVDLPWLDDLTRDQFLGGAIAWGTSEAPVVVVVIALVAQWARSDRRAAARADRHADTYRDDELDAYNVMLAELARTRR